MKRIMITGALGQIGSELTVKLRKLYGEENVLATDVRRQECEVVKGGPFQILDVLNEKDMMTVAKKYKADTVIHLAALLSATAERNPRYAWNLNMNGLIHALETVREMNAKLFIPSSIGVFGPSTPKDGTPQNTIQRPATMYGINKLTGELLAHYYFLRYGVDTRGLRFPGIISYQSPPGGGTTDYAVEIYCEAIKKGSYTSYLSKGTFMDMMYMPDALGAIVHLMEADGSKLKHRNAYNITSMSVAPENIAEAIQKRIPHFTIHYHVDPVRQKIADSWPNSIDSSIAKEEWGFNPQYDLAKMTEDMLENLVLKLGDK
ncbi:NAD-dependent epimerase/dehydratase family protein [Bacillus sp. B15-48]|uniref:NAD-dependent epimerase/dehydratase family protein n=1 Tax=Bacillus sp. B15-48 TaxID=1548601 RepID=UPI00193F7A2C|nr:NAD-dependent epimerase/dehydratase family protein [Bacillus sp. B15-48]MBM4763428.1 NAD-dependent epimerase/dehydratase family protein [Bacillus sp. B15-48]